MNPIVWVIIAVVVLIAIGLGAWYYMQRRRSEDLRRTFGPEYDRALREYGDRSRAEAALEHRKEHVEKLDIHPLSRADQQRFATSWRTTQAEFVDNPAAAIKNADRLIGDVMQARGYPVGNFEERASEVSVNHPQVVEHYRAAHRVALANERGQASTEDLRKAMIDYRALFSDLLGLEDREQPRGPQPPEQTHTTEAQQQ